MCLGGSCLDLSGFCRGLSEFFRVKCQVSKLTRWRALHWTKCWGRVGPMAVPLDQVLG